MATSTIASGMDPTKMAIQLHAFTFMKYMYSSQFLIIEAMSIVE